MPASFSRSPISTARDRIRGEWILTVWKLLRKGTWLGIKPGTCSCQLAFCSLLGCFPVGGLLGKFSDFPRRQRLQELLAVWSVLSHALGKFLELGLLDDFHHLHQVVQLACGEIELEKPLRHFGVRIPVAVGQRAQV